MPKSQRVATEDIKWLLTKEQSEFVSILVGLSTRTLMRIAKKEGIQLKRGRPRRAQDEKDDRGSREFKEKDTGSA